MARPLRCPDRHNPDTMAANRGVPVLASDLLARIVSYRGVFKATRGITLSGGEVLQQPAFCPAHPARCQGACIHTGARHVRLPGRNADDAMLADVDLAARRHGRRGPPITG
ncbi:MAG: hypothetical protein R2742_13495 [Micropruina glycogenica]